MALTRIRDGQLDDQIGGKIKASNDADLIAIANIPDSDVGYLFKSGVKSWDVMPTILGSSVAPVVDSGSVVQTIYSPVAAATGTTLISLAAAAPTITSGVQIWSANIIPSAETSRIKISGTFTYSSGTSARQLIVAVFRGSTCIGVTAATVSSANSFAVPVNIKFIDSPTTATSTTYSIRVGASTSSTWYVNKFSTAYFSNKMTNSIIELVELA